MPHYSFDEEEVKKHADYPAFVKWSNGRHEETALYEVWDKHVGHKKAEPKKVVKQLNSSEGGE
jgi:hypothetical protein